MPRYDTLYFCCCTCCMSVAVLITMAMWFGFVIGVTYPVVQIAPDECADIEDVLHDPDVLAIAARYNRTAAQVALRWVVQL